MRFVEILYVGIFMAYFLYIASDLSYNTAFVDEAIYASVGESALRGMFWESALSWMGGSYLYPIISASINRYFGLAGIRLFSAACLIVAGVVSGEIANYLKGEKARLVTLFLFLFSAISLNLGQLGTYDAPAVLFFSLSLLTALMAREESSKSYSFVLASAVLFAMAVLSKYIVVIMAPAILGVIFGFRFSRIYKMAIWGAVAYLVVAIFFVSYMEPLLTFFTGSAFKEPASKLKIFQETFKFMNFVLPTSILGFLVVFRFKRNARLLVLALVLGALLPFSYHFVFENLRSLWKHLVYSQILLSPLAGVFVYWVYEKLKVRFSRNVILQNSSQLLIVVSLLLALSGVWLNLRYHWEFQRSWPSMTPVLNYLSENSEYGDKIFAEGSAIFKYHLFTGFEDPSAWGNTWYFSYEGVEGTEAMKTAIENKEFDYIVLNGYFTGDTVYELLPVVNENYELVMKDTYRLSGLYDIDTLLWVPKRVSGLRFMLNDGFQPHHDTLMI